MNDLALQGEMPSILAIEKILKELPQVDCPVKSYIIDGVYVRAMFIPAGTVLTGKIHNHESIFILAQGTIRISNGNDNAVLSAPYIAIDKPGVKRLGCSETDVTFITVHRTDLTDIDQIEKTLVSDTFEEYQSQLLLTKEG